MNKDLIKNLLRENLFGEAGAQPAPSQGQPHGQAPQAANKRKGYKKEYADIQRALNNPSSLLTKSRVMAAANLGDPDDAGDRKAFNAKVDLEKNEEGSVRQFNDKELASVSKVISNPSAYLNKSNV